MEIKDKISKIKLSRLTYPERYLIETFNKCEQFAYDESIFYISDGKILFEVDKFKSLKVGINIWMVLSKDLKFYNSICDFVIRTIYDHCGVLYFHTYSEGWDKSERWHKALNKYKWNMFTNKTKKWIKVWYWKK